jgi:hypothetical protein
MRRCDRPLLFAEFLPEALKANLLRLEGVWEDYQQQRDRDAVYSYLSAVFELVSWWRHEGRAVEYAAKVLRIKGYQSADREPEPFATVIFATSDPSRVDDKTRSKWSRVLRYAAECKDCDQDLQSFIKRHGGLNKCAAKWAGLGRNGRSSQPKTVFLRAP